MSSIEELTSSDIGEPDMIGLIIIAASAVFMSRLAETEDRSPIVWGFLTLVLCVACGAFIPLGLVALVMGLVLSFLAMLVLNLIRE